MSTTKPSANSDESKCDWPYEGLKNPHIIELLRQMQDMPKWLEEQKRLREERNEFVRRVFEKAVMESGMIEKITG